MSSRAVCLALVLLCWWSSGRAAQEADSIGTLERQLEERLPPGFMDSVHTDSTVPADRRVKSPGGAVLRAMALPGWGQYYTGHPVRGTVTAVLETAFIAGMVSNFRDRAHLRDDLSGLEREKGEDWPVDDPQRLELNSRIKSYQRKAGDFMAYGITTLALGMLDSFVSAHLYRFDRNFQVSTDGRGRLVLACRF